MSLIVKDRVKAATFTAGTGTITLTSAAAGYQPFSVLGDGNTTYYAITDATTGDWEVGLGTYTLSGNTLARTTVLDSSNSGAAVNFAANVKDVFVTYPAGKAVLNGGALGTPSSGAVTNLTGTASININGTVGATTPAAGSFTTVTASGVVGTSATEGLRIPVGTTAQRGTASQGAVRYRTDGTEPGFEGYNGSAWGALGGGNTTTKGMWENPATLTANHTIGTNNNAVSAGPITVASGISVVIPSGSRWIIL